MSLLSREHTKFLPWVLVCIYINAKVKASEASEGGSWAWLMRLQGAVSSLKARPEEESPECRS